MVAETKVCSRCGKEKGLGEFYAKKKSRDGKTSHCKVCHDAWTKSWRLANPEKDRESARRRYAANPEGMREKRRKWGMANPEKLKEQRRKWRAANLEKDREYYRNKRAKNPERMKEQKRKWHVAHPERVWARQTLGDHRRRGLEIHISINELEKMAKKVRECPYCGEILGWSRGGAPGAKPNSPTLDRIFNGNVLDKTSIQIICHSCNLFKGNRPESEMEVHAMKLIQNISRLRELRNENKEQKEK